MQMGDHEGELPLLSDGAGAAGTHAGAAAAGASAPPTTPAAGNVDVKG